jgi:hypothetical protein
MQERDTMLVFKPRVKLPREGSPGRNSDAPAMLATARRVPLAGPLELSAATFRASLGGGECRALVTHQYLSSRFCFRL